MSGEFSQDPMIMLGRIEQMVIDLRAEAPKQNEAIQRLGDRTGAIERQMMTRHRENSDRLDILQTGLDAIKQVLAALERRLLAVEKPVSADATRKTHRRAWIRRSWQIIGSVGAAALLLIEPATKVAIEFWTKRYFDK